MSLDSIHQDFDPTLPLAEARTIPSRWYRDPGVLAAEVERVFGASWQIVARLDQLEKPGSYVTAEVGGEPILVLRDQAGTLRAFSNVCRHRAAILLRDPEGRVARLRCRYHGWTYDLEGSLRGVPEWDGVQDFCKEDNGLPRHHVATWGPFVWVHLGHGREVEPLHHFLSPMPEQLARAGIEGLRHVERRAYDLACNWKVFVDNYLDGGYHVPTVHAGLASVLDYTSYRTTIAGNTSLQQSPLVTPAEGETVTSAVRTGTDALYWWVFPNFMLNVYQGAMDTNLVLPLGPERCRVIIDFYFTPGAERVADSVAVGHAIQIEDVEICEDVQRGLNSRAYDTGRYSVRREVAVHHFHRLLAGRLSGE